MALIQFVNGVPIKVEGENTPVITVSEEMAGELAKIRTLEKYATTALQLLRCGCRRVQVVLLLAELTPDQGKTLIEEWKEFFVAYLAILHAGSENMTVVAYTLPTYKISVIDIVDSGTI